MAPIAVIGAALGAWWLAARILGIPKFRPLKEHDGLGRWRRLAVRMASSLGAYLVCFLLAFAGAKRLGTFAPTLDVRVLEGPAKRAGIEDGDRIVAVGGTAVATWSDMRARIQASEGPIALTVERRGQRFTRDVTPNEKRLIGIEQRSEQRPASAGEAAASAVSVSFAVRWYFFSRELTTLAGPVGIVKAVEKAPTDRLGGYLTMIALVTAWLWPAVLGFHLVDALLPMLRRWGA